ncbi:MAG TPA: PilZ domain-containing protein [Pyrinomonadaceae bacterium]|nr:PilZ domain-containing protein [Pyrinomonadaceae bacterium]
MPERLRSIANRLRQFVADRRRLPRYKARLPVVVSLLNVRVVATPATLSGHTCDASVEGLGLILPAIRIGDRYLVGEGHTLRINIKLPDASARLYGIPVRYERLEDGQPGRSYLVGLRLTETHDPDYALYSDYLKSLKG